MCLYPKLIKNKKYLPNKKNNWNPPKCEDYRLLYVTAACGKCLECRKQKQREWLVRMSEELRHDPNAYFMTLTLSEEKLEEYKNYATAKTQILLQQKQCGSCQKDADENQDIR